MTDRIGAKDHNASDWSAAKQATQRIARLVLNKNDAVATINLQLARKVAVQVIVIRERRLPNVTSN